MFKCLWCAVLLIFSAKNAFGGNILIAMDVPSTSHHIWHYALAEGLMENGHNITFLGPFSDQGKKSDKYHPLVTEDVLLELQKDAEFDFEETLANTNPFRLMELFIQYTCTVCEHSYQTKGFRTLLNYPNDFKFDLIIIDVTIGSCFYPLIQTFNYPPTIGSTAFLLPPSLSAIFGNGLHPSYIPFFHLQYSEDMSFFQRLLNYLLTYTDYFLRQTRQTKQLEKIARETFGDEMEPMLSLEKHISLLLSNVDIVFNQPQPMTPNIIPVGGLHVKRSKGLPEEFQKIMNNAKDGVILLCLGTNLRSDKLKPTTVKALLDAFAQLKQTIIWKFESNLNNLPSNVIIRKWVPQSSILAHPNLKLFISHGGALSTQEAAYYGVPIVGMPFIADQRIIVRNIVDRKLGLRLDAATVTTEEALNSINEVLKNPMYSHNMKEVSRRIRDLPNSPLETAVFWAEYSIKYNGTHFLSPRSRDMYLLQANAFDVELFLISVVFSLICLILALVKWCAKLSKTEKKVKVQ